jgi:hypothetical protein
MQCDHLQRGSRRKGIFMKGLVILVAALFSSLSPAFASPQHVNPMGHSGFPLISVTTERVKLPASICSKIMKAAQNHSSGVCDLKTGRSAAVVPLTSCLSAGNFVEYIDGYSDGGLYMELDTEFTWEKTCSPPTITYENHDQYYSDPPWYFDGAPSWSSDLYGNVTQSVQDANASFCIVFCSYFGVGQTRGEDPYGNASYSSF